MTFEQFIKIARKHVGLTSRHDYHPACLPENIRRDLSDDLNLETLQQWLSPVTDKKAIRVSALPTRRQHLLTVSLVLLAARRNPRCGSIYSDSCAGGLLYSPSKRDGEFTEAMGDASDPSHRFMGRKSPVFSMLPPPFPPPNPFSMHFDRRMSPWD